jgi:hypothetical protein
MVYFTKKYDENMESYDGLVALADKFLAHNDGEYIYNEDTGLTLTKVAKNPSVYVLSRDDGGDEMFTSSVYKAVDYLLYSGGRR